MLKELIINQNKASFANLDSNESVEPLLNNLMRKEKISTAVLLLDRESDPLPLFIFQDTLYAAYTLKENRFEPLQFSDYFSEMTQAYGMMNLYRISPVLFKTLLVLAQMEPIIVGTSDIIDGKRLLGRINQGKKEAVMALKRNQSIDLFYFRDGTLCDGYFEDEESDIKRSDLQTKLLDKTDFSQENPVWIELYEQIAVSPASGQDTAEEQIASISPSDIEMWTKLEDAPRHTPVPAEKEGQWAITFLNGDRRGVTLMLSKKRVSIGRGMGDIRLNDPQVSRHHADLEQSPEGLILYDKKSTNGSFVNDEKVSKKTVSVNDVIRFGDTRLKVVHRP